MFRAAILRVPKFNVRSGRIRSYTQRRTQSPSQYDGEIVGVEPVVSPLAVGASVVFVGGLFYYMYSEHRQTIASFLPFLGSPASEPSASSKPEQDARDKIRKQRAQMVPKSELTAAEQLKWAWTHPGLYVIGSNEFGLADPQHPGSVSGIKCAVPGLEGKLIRSAAFSKTHAAAVDSSGALFQWGTGFAGNAPHTPTCTLKDASICEVAATDHFVVLRDNKSRIRVLSGSNAPNQLGSNTDVTLSFEPRLGWRESVVSMSAGRSHIAVTTNSGHVYTAALDKDGNSRGQLGHGSSTVVQPLQLHRIQSDLRFTSTACGDEHTLLLTNDGDVLGCGANDFGQLATGAYSSGKATMRELAPLPRLWKNGFLRPQDAYAVGIAAGAATSYAQIVQGEARRVLAWGRGIDGQLGTGTLTHMQGVPVVIPELSDREEFDEALQARRPLGLRSLITGANHALAVCDNHSNVVLDKSGASVNASPLFGHDVVVWGSNAFGQCEPGRRHRFAEPAHPPPLFTSTSGNLDNKLPLQAAPPQWIESAQLRDADSSSLPKKVLVEQMFVAGPDVTAAFLRSCK
ncbi:hypothetical protein IWW49_002422 [Coemansia sp. RSA 1797]|nr:hypothetical protein IWW49_002422 [Coemansia sp. RSA 1797]